MDEKKEIENEDPNEKEKEKECIGYGFYLVWNGVRFLIIGILIFLANQHHNSDLKKIQKDCCKCYNISLKPENHNIIAGKRFDLSYCMPECTSCDYCQKIQNTTGQF